MSSHEFTWGLMSGSCGFFLDAREVWGSLWMPGSCESLSRCQEAVGALFGCPKDVWFSLWMSGSCGAHSVFFFSVMGIAFPVSLQLTASGDDCLVERMSLELSNHSHYCDKAPNLSSYFCLDYHMTHLYHSWGDT